MKKIVYIVLTSLFFINQLKAEDQEVIVKDRLKSVTVFMQNAQLFKESSVSIPQGTSYLIFNDVSPSINTASIQASGEGDFTILNTQYRYYMQPQSVKKPVVTKQILNRKTALEDSIYLSNLRLQKNQDLMYAIEKERNLILGHQLMKGNSNHDSIELLEGTIRLLRKELNELAQMKYLLSVKSKMMNDHHQMLKEELKSIEDQIQNHNIQPTQVYHHQVIVTVYSKLASKGIIKLNYLVGNAGWNPQYDLIAKNHQSDITLIYKAQVYQNTGEEWENVKITISNANPNQGNTKPVLPVWFVNFQRFVNQNRVKKELYVKEVATESLEDVQFDLGAKEKADLLYEYTNKVQNFSSVAFEINVPMHVSSNGKFHYMDLKKETIPTSFQLYLVPKLDKDAFVVARLTGWESLDLLMGEANIYYGNTFIGKTVLNPSILEDTLDVSMGRDRSIYVERKMIDTQTKNKLIENAKVYLADYEISIKNKNRGDISLIIEDHIPVSKNDKIEVQSTNGGGKLNKNSGTISWEIDLKGYEKKSFNYGFSIKYPKDEVLIL